MLSIRMPPAFLILISSLYVMSQAEAVEFYQSALVSVKSGERATLKCTFQDGSKSDRVVWYKQRFGEIPQEVGERFLQRDAKISPRFNSSGVKVERIDKGISLTISRAKKEDEGLYFCGLSNWEKAHFFNGTFLAVTGDGDVKVSVSQMGVWDSVPAGASVTLQCSVLSESRAAELQVLWFRAAPPQSHPQIIYTHHNSSRQCESGSSTHTCVYNLSKNILSLNDTGTYYCAVVACGRIILGNGTRVQLAPGDPRVICLAAALGVCVVLIVVQAAFNWRIRNTKQSRVRLTRGSIGERLPNQVDDAEDLNYAGLHFNQRKTKRMRRTKNQPEECVYSEVLKSSAT